jgi:hypothetical protein
MQTEKAGLVWEEGPKDTDTDNEWVERYHHYLIALPQHTEQLRVIAMTRQLWQAKRGVQLDFNFQLNYSRGLRFYLLRV